MTEIRLSQIEISAFKILSYVGLSVHPLVTPSAARLLKHRLHPHESI